MVYSEYKPNFILEIQNYLNNANPAGNKIGLTGVYDEATRNALLAFQKINGLPPTGYIDAPAFFLLVRKNNDYLRRAQMPGKIAVSNSDFAEVKKGDQKDLVYSIKVMLNSFYRRYSNYPKLEMTNIYDEKTEEAISLFQQRSMLPVTGIVDIKTWNSLCQIYDGCRLYK